MEHLGSTELLSAIGRIRPKLVVCGHFHGGHGRFVYEDVLIHNVSVVNDDYQLVWPPTVIDIPEW
jgi:Icc-related predicted phosphoesterase